MPTDEEIQALSDEGFCLGHLNDFLDYFDWFDIGTKGKILTVVDFPRLIAQHLTIYWAVEGKFLRSFFVLLPLGFFVFIFTAFQLWVTVYWHYTLPVAAVCSIISFFATLHRVPVWLEWIYIIQGLFASILWIYFIANELVSLLSAAGLIIGISDAIMGLTVLAWGNSVGDMVSNVIVARKGHPQMAVGACYAAPLTNMLLGLGVSISAVVVSKGPYELVSGQILSNNIFFGFVFLLTMLIVTVIVVPLTNFTFLKKFGVGLILLYVVATTVAFLTEFKIILPNTQIFYLWGF